MKMYQLAMLTLVVSAMVACGSSSTGGSGGGSGGSAGGKGGGSGGGSGGGAAGGAGGGAAGGAGGGAAGGAGGGSSLPACSASYAGGCTQPIDLTGGGNMVTFDFATTNGAPKCIKVKNTQAVQFTGVTASPHPMSPLDCGPANVIATTQTATFTRTFSVTGIYGAHCEIHGTNTGTGMAVAIQSVP